ncbi:DNA-binding domain-containing protein [Sphingobium sp. H39-3-25]|uniref:DNA-binding domain-containing protein n=1 Tax=Sphingobium arseniciresistens TaxID=3030834 RepID=UPI0023B9FFDC|nr:DNA-binding domain-containing protein [Sphingobium arseniciresistens]
MSLIAMQRDFRDWLTDRPGSMMPWVGDAESVGLAIYHNAYRVQLADCLHDMFEKTALWLGDDAFMAAARIHIESTPPNGWTLGIYGDGFDRTLARLYPDDPEIAELAWLDWSLSRAFAGADATPLAPDVLARVDWDKAGLVFVPTLLTGAAATNAGAIWSALAAEGDPPMGELLPEPGTMLVWRQGFTPCFRTIETDEAQALGFVLAGASFSALCAMLVEIHGEEAGVANAGSLLGQWIGEGLITDIIEGQG